MKNEISIPENFPLPTNKSVWVLEEQAHETKTKSGIIIPEMQATGDNAEGTKGVGVIYAVGPLVDVQVACAIVGILPMVENSMEKITMKEGYRNIRPGDKVMYNLYANRGISIDGFYYIMMHESDIYSVMPDEDMIVMRKQRIDRRRAAVQLKKSDAGASGSEEIIGKA